MILYFRAKRPSYTQALVRFLLDQGHRLTRLDTTEGEVWADVGLTADLRVLSHPAVDFAVDASVYDRSLLSARVPDGTSNPEHRKWIDGGSNPSAGARLRFAS
jgi:hypothetical protein